MKSTLFYLAGLTTLVFAGCTQDNIAPQIESTTVSLFGGNATYSDGFLVFNSVQEWSNTISVENKDLNEFWLEELHQTDFISLRDVQVDEKKRQSVLAKAGYGLVSFDVSMNEFVMSLVSTKGLVQIGNYIFRVNWQDETAYVIKSSDSERSFASLLTEDLNDPSVMFFTTEDDIFAAIQFGNGQGTKGRIEWCRAEKAKADADRYGQEFGGGYLDQWWYDVEHKYVNGLIYFELTTKSDYTVFDSGTFEWNPNIYQQLTFSFDWEACNGSTGSGSSVYSYSANKTNNEWYRGSSRLRNYDLSSTFRYRSHLAGSPLYIARLEDI